MINLEKIGNKISVLRKQNDMKQNELADALYVTHQAVSKWENGKSIPSIDALYEMTKLFKVSIDYLLDDSDIKEDDYATMLKLYPRESVISKFLQKENLDIEVEKIFYLLNNSERLRFINLMINNKISLQPKDIWHLLSSDERTYLLGVILSNKYLYDLSKIYNNLSIEEQTLVNKRYKKGIYINNLQKRKEVIQ